MTPDLCFLSVVIITRNEEKNISKSIESVLDASKDIKTEIILVDSASTDRTIEIALKYPIKILQLNPGVPLSPGAGYYIGYNNSHGNYIHFHCGDMILDKNWFKNAIPIFGSDDRVGGVFGLTTQEQYNTHEAKKYMEAIKNLVIGDVKYYAGDALFKRETLQRVGTFNPFLRAGEEGELSYRVIEGGYKLLRLPYPMSHHLGFASETFSSSIKKNIRYTMGQGQIFRYSLDKKKIFICRLKEYKFKIVGFFLMILGFISALSAYFLAYFVLIYLWVIGNILFFGWIIYETKSVKNAMRRFCTQTLKSPFFVWGFLEPKKNPEVYLNCFTRIKS
jgi:glycosyltransferase involved in cell wall biosynthesis